MIKPLIYIASFLAAFVIMFICAALLLALVLGFVSFVSWSLPLASPFTWIVFRIICAIAFVLAILWSFSKENKEFVDRVVEDISNEKIT